MTGVTLHVGRATARPAIESVRALAGSGRLRPEVVTDRVTPFEVAATELVEPHTKLVFDAGMS